MESLLTTPRSQGELVLPSEEEEEEEEEAEEEGDGEEKEKEEEEEEGNVSHQCLKPRGTSQ